MYIAWTTTETREEAEILSEKAVEQGLAACAQIDGPISSVYYYKGALNRSAETRITFKCLQLHLQSLKNLVLSEHPYDTPQWTVAKLEDVGEAYLEWAQSTSDNRKINDSDS